MGALPGPRQRLGMGGGLLARQLSGRAGRRHGLDRGRLQEPCPSRRLLAQRSGGPAGRLPLLELDRRAVHQPRVSAGEDAGPLILGAVAEAREHLGWPPACLQIVWGPEATMNARRTAARASGGFDAVATCAGKIIFAGEPTMRFAAAVACALMLICLG